MAKEEWYKLKGESWKAQNTQKREKKSNLVAKIFA